MKWLNCTKIRLVLIVFAAAIMLCGGSAKADFTFGDPTNLGPPMNSSATDFLDCISTDGLEMYLTSDRSGDWDIWVAKRETINDDWGIPVNLGPTINTNSSDYLAYLSPDGLELYFTSYRRAGGSGGDDIWMTRRTTRHDPWNQPTNLGPAVNSSANEWSPSISPDGLELYFGADRSAGYGSSDIWISKRATTNKPWGLPMNLGPSVNSSACEGWIFLSSDGLALFFSGERNTPHRPGGFGDADMWMTRRASISDTWDVPVNLGPIVNSSSLDCGPRISPDGSMLYFSSNRHDGLGGMYGDIYQAPIIPIVDFNGDGDIGISDLVILINNWGQNNPSVDIGPMPWGDGIVDKADVEMLMKYWGQEFDDPALIAHWKLDETEGTDAFDSAGNIEAEVYGDPVWCPADGMVNGALMLDGIDDCVGTWEIPGLSDGDFTMIAWVKGSAPGQVVISEFHGVSWLMADADSGCLKTNLRGTGQTDQPLVSEASITNGEWHRIGISWDGTNRVLIVDDVAVASDMLRNLERSEVELNIGCGPDSTSGTFFSGMIDDVRIYNRAIIP